MEATTSPHRMGGKMMLSQSWTSTGRRALSSPTTTIEIASSSIYRLEDDAVASEINRHFVEFQSLGAFRAVRWDRVQLIRPTTKQLDLQLVGLADRISPGRYTITIWPHDRGPYGRRGLRLRLAKVKATLLHEMAHVARWNGRVGHDGTWKRCFVEAAEEVTGMTISAAGKSWQVDSRVELALWRSEP